MGESSSGVLVIVLFDGVWEKQGLSWAYNNGTTRVISMKRDVTFSELVDKLYDLLVVDRLLFELKLEVPYVCGGFSIPPALISTDDEVALFMEENTKSPQHRIPLCVTPTEKIINVDQSPRLSVNKEIKNNDLFRSPSVTIIPETDESRSEHEYEYDHVNGDFHKNDDCVADLNVDNDVVTNQTMGIKQRVQQVEQSYVPSRAQSQGPNQAPVSVTPSTSYSRATKTQDPCSWESKFTAEDIDAYVRPTTSSSNGICGELYLGKMFETKVDLKAEAHLFAMKNNFEFVVKQSSTDRWYIKCKDVSCFWRLRGKKLSRSGTFEITVFNNKHTCPLDVRDKDHRQATPWVVGHLIKNKYAFNETGYKVNNIKEDMKKQYGVDMTYEKAWRCRKKAIGYVRGTLESSYVKLPAYLYMLQQKNPGTITDFVIEDGRFQYCFFSIGASRRGFSSCRPVICLDSTLLKTKYGGHFLCAVALDANSQLYPIAFSIVDSENHDSWAYFMRKLKETIGDVQNLAFVSSRHANITYALELVFPNFYHGTCFHHLKINVATIFKTDRCHTEIGSAAYAFRKFDFEKHFLKIREKDPGIAQYLEDVGFEKWSRAYFPGNRYNVMTSNYAKNLNDKMKEARSYPITTFVEFVRLTLQSWFSARRDVAAKSTAKLAPLIEEDLHQMAEKAKFLQVYGLSQHEFNVIDGNEDSEVNMVTKTCNCSMFRIISIPCVHVVAVALYRNINIYSLCDPIYSIETWRTSYADTIYPCGNEDDWIVPEEIKNMDVRVHVHKNPVGRPKKKKSKIKRLPPHGEKIVMERKCSQCDGRGHNKASCKVRH